MEISPFTVAVRDEAIVDLKTRLATTRWPDRELVDDWTQGAPLAYVQELCEYWANEYDWRRCEAELNVHPNFTTEVDGLRVHFLHVRSPHADATPMIISHGWPGSVLEFQKVIDPLTNPTAHGGTEADAFHLVIPSLPGYGWSEHPTSTGTGIEKIAEMWDALMVRLGYDDYIAQGGDWGGAITTEIGIQARGACRAIHTTMPMAAPAPETMAELTDAERSALKALSFYDRWDSGFSKQQSTRPQTVGYGLTDSPAGQAAWIVEKFHAWTDCDGHPENALTRDELLDNISLYWFTETATSSARLYWESYGQAGLEQVQLPAGCSMFPKEIIRPSRRWAEQRYRNIVYWNELDQGGHFPALEVPGAFVAELRAAKPFLLQA